MRTTHHLAPYLQIDEGGDGITVIAGHIVDQATLSHGSDYR